MARSLTSVKRACRSVFCIPYYFCAILQCKHTKRKTVLLTLCVSATVLISIVFYVSSNRQTLDAEIVLGYTSPVESFRTSRADVGVPSSSTVSNNSDSPSSRKKTDKRVLVLADTGHVRQARDILISLEANRFRYKREYTSKPLPALTHKGKGKYSLIIFQRFESYINMVYQNRDALDNYCRRFNVGVISFTNPAKQLTHAQAMGFPLYIQTQLELQDFEINPLTVILNVTKAGTRIQHIPGMFYVVLSISCAGSVCKSFTMIHFLEVDNV